MKWDKYKFKLDKYMYENWTFRIVTLIMAGVIVFEGYLISDKVNNQKVVFMPPKMVTKEFWVAGNVVSKTYLEQMGFFISSTLLNIDSQTSKYTIHNILPLVEPNFYYKVKSMLQEQINYIKDNFKGFNYPALDLFLKGLGITNSDPALIAWEAVQELIPYMKETTLYKSEDVHLISTLAKIKISVIMSMQESVDMYTNKINSYQLAELKERFLRTYREFAKSGEYLELVATGKNERRNSGRD